MAALVLPGSDLLCHGCDLEGAEREALFSRVEEAVREKPPWWAGTQVTVGTRASSARQAI